MRLEAFLLVHFDPEYDLGALALLALDLNCSSQCLDQYLAHVQPEADPRSGLDLRVREAATLELGEDPEQLLLDLVAHAYA